MNQSIWRDPRWFHATTLRERVASLLSAQATPIWPNNNEGKEKRTRRRLARWRSQEPFADDKYFNLRLVMGGLTEAQFLHLLGEPSEVLANRFPDPPTWLMTLSEAFSPHPPTNSQMTLPEQWHNQAGSEFLPLIEPLIRHFCFQLGEGIQTLAQAHSDLPFSLDTIDEVLRHDLPSQLMVMLNRTMVLELRVASLQGLLVGETPEARFESFLQRLRQREVALSLFLEYPVLACQLVGFLALWHEAKLELMQRLCTDWEAIRQTFCPNQDPGVLVGVESSVGDRHRGGRSVTILTFSSDFRLVYKPKPLAIDVHFQEFLTRLNERGAEPPFRTLKILNRGAYGWVEFVSPQSCTSVEEIERFYERQGGNLALLYMLRATDFHFENIMAVGEHPVLVDLESLFQVTPEYMRPRESGRVHSTVVADSVLRVSLLPQRNWVNEQSEGIDVSALGMMPGQLSAKPVPYWENRGSDEMHLGRKRLIMQGGHNRPKLKGSEVNILPYSKQFINGFTTIYKLLLKYRDKLLSENGPLACFAEEEVRIILRPTMLYKVMLDESFYPNLCRDALERDRFFDKLWVNIKVEERPEFIKIIQAEQADLQKGDFPIFTTRPNSRDLWCSSGERVADFFAEAGLTLVQDRLQQFSQHDLEQQIWFIRASLTALSMSAAELLELMPSYQISEPRTCVTRTRLLKAAAAIGDRLEELALWDGDKVTWIGLKAVHDRHWNVSTLDIDLYSGLPGVALFLAYLGTLTGKEGYTTLAEAAFASMTHQIAHQKSWLTAIGAFHGWGGIIYTLTHLGVLWNRPTLLAEAQTFVELIPGLIEQDKQFDLLGGAAGCIATLLSLYSCMPSEQTLDVAIQCGDHLLSNSKRMPQGLAWLVPAFGEKPLTGFSHGAAGMASALLDLAALSGQERFRTAALEALAYERSLFELSAGNWADLRKQSASSHSVNEQPARFMTAWCHGAPGIGLARLRSLRYLDNAQVRQDISVAVKTTLAQGFGQNHSLCHGDLGNLELLISANEMFDDWPLQAEIERLTAVILQSIEAHGWLCGVPLGVETPGLMVGLAGIGYQLLRLAAPERVPSVLMLAAPDIS